MRSLALICCLLVAPALAHAQAEPAPEGYIPPGKEAPPPPPPSPLKWRIAADGRVPIALREPNGLPTAGWGAGAQVTRALIDVGRIRFGLGADFGYARFATDLFVRQPDFTHHLAHMTFAALFVLDAMLGRTRPWVAAGAGLSAAWYYQPNPDPHLPATDERTVVPLVALEAGLSGAIYRNIDLGIVAHLDLTFSSQSVGVPPYTVFSGGIFSLRFQVGFRF